VSDGVASEADLRTDRDTGTAKASPGAGVGADCGARAGTKKPAESAEEESTAAVGGERHFLPPLGAAPLPGWAPPFLGSVASRSLSCRRSAGLSAVELAMTVRSLTGSKGCAGELGAVAGDSGDGGGVHRAERERGCRNRRRAASGNVRASSAAAESAASNEDKPGSANVGVGGVEEPTVEADEDDREGDDTPPLHNFLRDD
jgi:hypothetical protein